MIIPVVGDLSGPQAVKAIGQYVAEIKERVSAFYVSNVEFYLQRQGTFDKFVDNLRSSQSTTERNYKELFSTTNAPDHPQAEPHHFSTQLMEHIDDLDQAVCSRRVRCLQ